MCIGGLTSHLLGYSEYLLFGRVFRNERFVDGYHLASEMTKLFSLHIGDDYKLYQLNFIAQRERKPLLTLSVPH